MTTSSDLGKTLADVAHYYGQVLQSSADLKTDACCPTGAIPAAYRSLINRIHPDILNRFYGCGSPLPFALQGCTVLDLGCGTGRDAYVLSALVGEQGRVIGVDMTEEQLAVARKHLDYQMKAFDYAKPNISFQQGLIEDLAGLGLEDNSVDVVVSNCVINLSPQKERVFAEIFRVLKPGGELYFADIFASCRIPEELALDPLLRGECLGGAMYTEDFRRLLASMGYLDYLIVSSSALKVQNPEVEAKIGHIEFCSQTIRAFKLALEDRPENYAQTATYQGSLPESPNSFILDENRAFKTGQSISVCGNTATILRSSRYAPHFQVTGNSDTHFGPFSWEPAIAPVASSGSCC